MFPLLPEECNVVAMISWRPTVVNIHGSIEDTIIDIQNNSLLSTHFGIILHQNHIHI